MPSKRVKYKKNNPPSKIPKIVNIAHWVLDSVWIIALFITFSLSLPLASPSFVYIPKGMSYQGIITNLSQNGVEVTGWDGLILRFIGSPQSGWLKLNDGVMSTADFLYNLTIAKAYQREVMLIPGETVDGFFSLLAKNFGFNKNKLMTYYTQQISWRDGWLVANTYRIPPQSDEETLIRYLHERSLKKNKERAEHYLGRYDDAEWKRYTVIASIIQKEAGNNKEMPLVASVIYNRLKIGMPLQMDGTLNYGENSHKKVTPDMIKHDNSDYNTYKHRGLPQEPVCSVSKEALEAAIRPAHTNYLYFMRIKEGEHQFSAKYSDHINVIKSVK